MKHDKVYAVVNGTSTSLETYVPVAGWLRGGANDR